MARYRIVRIYEVPAENRYQATDRMMEAIQLGTEKDYLVKDVVRLSKRDGPGTKIDLRPPVSWLRLLMDQLFGRTV